MMTRDLILVVCEGNLARSPLVAALLSHRLGGHVGLCLDVESAGTRAADGAPAATSMCEVARGYGMELNEHQSRWLTVEHVREATLVLTMSELQREDVQRLVPAAMGRVFTLVELVRLLSRLEEEGAVLDNLSELTQAAHAARPRSIGPEQAEDVEDPYGRDDAEFAASGQRIAELVDRLMDRMVATLAHRKAPVVG